MSLRQDPLLADPKAPPGHLRAFSLLFRFHLRVGARLALRRLAPVAAVFLALYVILRPEFFAALFDALERGSAWLLGAFTAGLVLLFSSLAAPRLCLGLSGWLRHLPSSAAQRRRAALAGMWVSLVPVLLGLAFVYALTHLHSNSLNAAYLAGLPVLGWAAAQAVLPVENKGLSRPLSFAGSLLSVSGAWLYPGLSLILLWAADRVSGPIERSGRTPVRSSQTRTRGLTFVILWRALRWRLVPWYVLSGVPFLLVSAYLSNSVVTPLQRQRALLFGTALALVCFTALAASGAAARRPVWPWLRCLPGSARSRILGDAVFLGLHAAPLLVPLGLLDFYACAVVGLGLPALSLYAAATIRRAPEQKMSALGLVSLAGSLGAMVLALFPPAALLGPALMPLLVKHGASLDRGQKVSRWLEIHHLAAGDPYSWSPE